MLSLQTRSHARVGSVTRVERLDGVGSPELRATLRFVRAQPRPVTAGELAAALSVARSVARWRLERLCEAGLLVPAFERRSGRAGPGGGRPAKTYAVAAESAAIEFPPRRYDELLRLLVAALPRRGRGARLVEVGEAFGRQLAAAARLRPAATLRGALERVCDGLGGLGFHAALASASEREAVIVTATCPLRPLLGADVEARAIDRGMWRGLVAAALPGAAGTSIECETRDCLDSGSACRVHVVLAGRGGRAARRRRRHATTR